MIKKQGVKGFDLNLRCMGFQYEVGKTYIMDDSPVLCKRGFHYCDTLNETYSFYSKKNKSRYCLVDILGDIEKGVGKNCTNKIKIVRELSEDEIKGTIDFSVEDFMKYNNMGYAIGGSTALKYAYGYNIEKPNDLDLVCSNIDKNQILKDFSSYVAKNSIYDSKEVISFIDMFGRKIDVLNNQKASGFVYRNYSGREIMFSDERQIWLAKLRYALNGSIKHMKDIKANGIEFDFIQQCDSKIDDDLQF